MKKDVPFLIGCEDFPRFIEENAYYVDKTSYLKHLFLSTSEVKVAHFIRPRRFGKTLNMSMIKEFCRLNYQNPGNKSYQQKLFIDNGRNLAVAGDEYKELRDKVMGEYPVISISFKTVEGGSFAAAVSQLLYKFSLIYDEFSFLLKSTRQNTFDLEEYYKNYEFCKTKQ
ncbi:MAG: AAA family ATPase, partial [Succinivibrio sp.]|nr:AAA family ATPase [Succinivibrio sp.]